MSCGPSCRGRGACAPTCTLSLFATHSLCAALQGGQGRGWGGGAAARGAPLCWRPGPRGGHCTHMHAQPPALTQARMRAHMHTRMHGGWAAASLRLALLNYHRDPGGHPCVEGPTRTRCPALYACASEPPAVAEAPVRWRHHTHLIAALRCTRVLVHHLQLRPVVAAPPPLPHPAPKCELHSWDWHCWRDGFVIILQPTQLCVWLVFPFSPRARSTSLHWRQRAAWPRRSSSWRCVGYGKAVWGFVRGV